MVRWQYLCNAKHFLEPSFCTEDPTPGNNVVLQCCIAVLGITEVFGKVSVKIQWQCSQKKAPHCFSCVAICSVSQIVTRYWMNYSQHTLFSRSLWLHSSVLCAFILYLSLCNVHYLSALLTNVKFKFTMESTMP